MHTQERRAATTDASQLRSLRLRFGKVAHNQSAGFPARGLHRTLKIHESQIA